MYGTGVASRPPAILRLLLIAASVCGTGYAVYPLGQLDRSYLSAAPGASTTAITAKKNAQSTTCSIDPPSPTTSQ